MIPHCFSALRPPGMWLLALCLASTTADFLALQNAVDVILDHPESCPYSPDNAHELYGNPDCNGELCDFPHSLCRIDIHDDKWDCWQLPDTCKALVTESGPVPDEYPEYNIEEYGTEAPPTTPPTLPPTTEETTLAPTTTRKPTTQKPTTKKPTTRRPTTRRLRNRSRENVRNPVLKPPAAELSAAAIEAATTEVAESMAKSVIGQDWHAWCCYWAAKGDCEEDGNPGFMRPICGKACGTPACSFSGWESCAVKLDPTCSSPSEALKGIQRQSSRHRAASPRITPRLILKASVLKRLAIRKSRVAAFKQARKTLRKTPFPSRSAPPPESAAPLGAPDTPESAEEEAPIQSAEEEAPIEEEEDYPEEEESPEEASQEEEDTEEPAVVPAPSGAKKLRVRAEDGKLTPFGKYLTRLTPYQRYQLRLKLLKIKMSKKEATTAAPRAPAIPELETEVSSPVVGAPSKKGLALRSLKLKAWRSRTQARLRRIHRTLLAKARSKSVLRARLAQHRSRRLLALRRALRIHRARRLRAQRVA